MSDLACFSCVLWDRFGRTSGAGLCSKGYGWQDGYERAFECSAHLAAGSLSAALYELESALAENRRVRRFGL